MMELVFELVPRDEVFGYTGIQFMQINTLYQLFAAKRAGELPQARRLLNIPDLFNHRLTGEARSETTIASTTGTTGGGAARLVVPAPTPRSASRILRRVRGP